MCTSITTSLPKFARVHSLETPAAEPRNRLWSNNLIIDRRVDPPLVGHDLRSDVVILVTFWCELGSHEVTEEHRPGQTPRYCVEQYVEAQRALNRLRVKALHEKSRGPRKAWERRPGRPQKG